MCAEISNDSEEWRREFIGKDEGRRVGELRGKARGCRGKRG